MATPLFSLTGRKILVVGAGGGIGSETSKRLAQAGAFVILLESERGIQGAREVLKQIQADGGSGMCLQCDICNNADCLATLDTISQAGHEIDSLAFVAGVVSTKNVLNGDVAELLSQVDLHAGSLMRLLQPLIPKWLEAGRGTAIVMTSIAAELPAIDKHLYSASKAAATALVLGLAGSFGNRGLRFIPVLANRVGTPSALERAAQSATIAAEMVSTQLSDQWIKPEEVAAAFHYLMSDEARPVNGDPFYITDGAKSGLAARPDSMT